MTLLDANVLVHYLKGDPLVVERLHRSTRGELAVPCVAVYELEYGTLKARGAWRRTRLEAVLGDLGTVTK